MILKSSKKEGTAQNKNLTARPLCHRVSGCDACRGAWVAAAKKLCRAVIARERGGLEMWRQNETKMREFKQAQYKTADYELCAG